MKWSDEIIGSYFCKEFHIVSVQMCLAMWKCQVFAQAFYNGQIFSYILRCKLRDDGSLLRQNYIHGVKFQLFVQLLSILVHPKSKHGDYKAPLIRYVVKL